MPSPISSWFLRNRDPSGIEVGDRSGTIGWVSAPPTGPGGSGAKGAGRKGGGRWPAGAAVGRRAGGTAVPAMAAAGGAAQAGQWGQGQRLGNEAIVLIV